MRGKNVNNKMIRYFLLVMEEKKKKIKIKKRLIKKETQKRNEKTEKNGIHWKTATL